MFSFRPERGLAEFRYFRTCQVCYKVWGLQPGILLSVHSGFPGLTVWFCAFQVLCWKMWPLVDTFSCWIPPAWGRGLAALCVCDIAREIKVMVLVSLNDGEGGDFKILALLGSRPPWRVSGICSGKAVAQCCRPGLQNPNESTFTKLFPALTDFPALWVLLCFQTSQTKRELIVTSLPSQAAAPRLPRALTPGRETQRLLGPLNPQTTASRHP